MSNKNMKQIEVNSSKKAVLKHWWILLFAIIIVSLVACTGGYTTYELSKTISMNRQDIIDKFGNPDEVLSNDSDGYFYGYDAGFAISGTDKGATEIVIMSDSVKKKTSDNYKIMDVTLGSSFEENIKRLGEPDLSTNDGQKGAMYLTKEDYILTFMTGYDSDSIEVIKLTSYDNSVEAITLLDISNLLGNFATEEDLKKAYKINQKSTGVTSTMYNCKGFDLSIGNKNDMVENIFISEEGIFNISGIKIGSNLNEVKSVFGEPNSSREGVLNTTQYVFYDNGFIEKEIQVTIDNNTSKVEYLEASIQNDDYFESYVDSPVNAVYDSYFTYCSEEETVGEAFDSFFINTQWESNVENGYEYVYFYGTVVNPNNNQHWGAVGPIFQIYDDDSMELIEAHFGNDTLVGDDIDGFLEIIYNN